MVTFTQGEKPGETVITIIREPTYECFMWRKSFHHFPSVTTLLKRPRSSRWMIRWRNSTYSQGSRRRARANVFSICVIWNHPLSLSYLLLLNLVFSKFLQGISMPNYVKLLFPFLHIIFEVFQLHALLKIPALFHLIIIVYSCS